MFYCERCRVKNEWPTSMANSYGQCEVCGVERRCYDRSSVTLPPLKHLPQDDLIPVRQKDRIDKFLELFSMEEKVSWVGKDGQAPDWVVQGITWFLGQDPGRQELYRRLKES